MDRNYLYQVDIREWIENGLDMIDDEVVKAKAEAAEEMSVASGMKYVMYPESVEGCKQRRGT